MNNQKSGLFSFKIFFNGKKPNIKIMIKDSLLLNLPLYGKKLTRDG